MAPIAPLSRNQLCADPGSESASDARSCFWPQECFPLCSASPLVVLLSSPSFLQLASPDTSTAFSLPVFFAPSPLLGGRSTHQSPPVSESGLSVSPLHPGQNKIGAPALKDRHLHSSLWEAAWRIKSANKSISFQLQGWGRPTNSELHNFAGDTHKLFFFVKTGENSDKFQMISKHSRGSDLQEADKIGIR